MTIGFNIRRTSDQIKTEYCQLLRLVNKEVEERKQENQY